MSDYKFDIDGKEISSEQVKAGKKDFNTFYKKYAASNLPFYKKGWFWGAAGMATVLVAIGLLSSSESEIINPSENASNATVVSESAKKSEQQPFVNPPINGVNVVWENLTVDAAKGGVLENQKGSKLTFSAFSFVDKNGNPVSNGEVDIKYREFTDQLDQIVSGIPMTYDSAGTTYQFLSGGMMEIKGFKDDEEVFIAPGKNVKVEMVSTDASTDHNLYKLDVEGRNWSCLGKDVVKPVTELELNDSIQGGESTNNTTAAAKNIEERKAKLQQSPEYQKLEKQKIAISSEINQLEKAKPIAPKKADKEASKFNFDYDASEFPELSEYADVQFQLSPGAEINPADAERVWNDIVIEKENGQYKIVFKEEASSYQTSYVADPVYEGKSYEKAKTIFDQKHEEYQKTLAAKLSAMKRVRTQVKNLTKKLNPEFQAAQNMARSYVQRIFTINEFGTYNCDTPVAKRRFEKNRTRVEQISFNGQNLINKSVFYLNASYNTYFNRNLTEKEAFLFKKKGSNYLILIEGDQFAFIKPKQFDKITSKYKGKFAFGDLQKVKSLKNLRLQIGL